MIGTNNTKKRDNPQNKILVTMIIIVCFLAFLLLYVMNGNSEMPNNPDVSVQESSEAESETVDNSEFFENSQNESETESEETSIDEAYANNIKSKYTLEISEIMPSATMYFDENGNASGWIELYNYGNSTVDLNDLCVTGGNGFNPSCELSGNIEPKHYYTVYLASIPSGISKGKTASVYHKSNVRISSVELPSELKKDFSFAKNGLLNGSSYVDSEYVITSLSTPNFANNSEGREKYLENEVTGKLIIKELMSCNTKFLIQNNKTYDWIEIKNVSSSEIDISEYSLSNKYEDLEMFKLPKKKLLPNESVIIYCSKDTSISSYHAPFKISSDMERIYLSSAGKISDCILAVNIPTDYSMGRINGKKGFYYFDSPLPNKVQTKGYRSITPTPSADKAPGPYSDSSLTIELKGDGTIHYTTDGSKPNENSPVYKTPLKLTKNTVIRAYSVSEGRIDSQIYTLPYILNANHELPVVSIAIEPDDMWSKEKGIYHGEKDDKNANYWKKWEREANLSIFSNETGNVSIDCGIKLSGDGSRELPKKSFQFRFRSLYGKDDLEYDIFGDGKYTVFDAIKLRAGEGYLYSLFIDELTTALAGDNTTVDVQNYRFCVLYINGEYFGIYCFRDKIDENYVEYITGADKDNVTLVGYNGDLEYGSLSDYNALIKYVKNNNLSDKEKYDYIKSIVDIDSITDWFINQAYSNNRDLANDRCYKVDGGKWKWILYDTDWGFIHHKNDNPFYLLDSTYKGTADILRALFKNSEYKDYFLKRLANQLDNGYTYDNICEYCDNFKSLLEDEMPNNCNKWGSSVSSWNNHIEKLKTFAKTRKEEMIKAAVSYFKLNQSDKNKYFG